MKISSTEAAYGLLHLLRSFGCDPFMIVLQDGDGRFGIVSLDTECSAFVFPRRRWEENRLRAGGYADLNGMFFRGEVLDPGVEARFIARYRFPKRAPLARRIAVDPNFQTPHVDLERLPGIWKTISFTSTRKEARRQLFSLTLRRHRGRWRLPRHLTVLTLSENNEHHRRARVLLSPGPHIEEGAFRATFLELEKV